MSAIAIRGAGWVTPLGHRLDEVWNRLAAGERAAVTSAEPAHYIAVAPEPFHALARAPRIRRSSVISLFGIAAAYAAMEQAGLSAGKLNDPARTAVIFAICSGGVHYTRRFYEKVAAEGAAGASPLLFPETVYNAPASHLSAMLGIDGASYTVVGDGSVGLAGLQLAEELLLTIPSLEQCILVGAEECDWILWEGYRTWRLLTSAPCVEYGSNRGMLLAEGASALVLGRATGVPGEIAVRTVTGSYESQRTASPDLQQVLNRLPRAAEIAWVVGSGNGTWVDRAEASALDAAGICNAPRFFPRCLLGDALAASAITQVILGALALQNGAAPFAQGNGPVLVTALGLNQQTGAALLQRS